MATNMTTTGCCWCVWMTWLDLRLCMCVCVCVCVCVLCSGCAQRLKSSTGQTFGQ